MGQQAIEIGLLRCGQLLQHIAEIGLRINAVDFS